MFLLLLVASRARNVGRSDGSSLSTVLQSVALCHSIVKEASSNDAGVLGGYSDPTQHKR